MTVDSRSLVALSDFKAMLGVSGTNEDAIINIILGQSIGVMEARYDRRFLNDSNLYSEWIDASPGATVRLSNWPVVRIVSLGVGSRVAFRVRLDPSIQDYIGGMFSVTETRTLLERLLEGSVSISTHLFSAYVTVAEIVGAVDSVDGVTATLVEDGMSMMLIPTAPMDMFLRDVDVMSAVPSSLRVDLDSQRGLLTFPESVWSDFSPGRVCVRYTAGYGDPESDSTLNAAKMVQQQIASYLYVSRRRDSGTILGDVERPNDDTYIEQILEANSHLKEVR